MKMQRIKNKKGDNSEHAKTDKLSFLEAEFFFQALA